MDNYEKVDKYCWNVASIWRNAGMEMSRYVGCTLYIMCLRKMIEENACVDPRYMSTIVELTKVLYRPVSIEDIEVIKSASMVLEETYKVKPGLLQDVLSSFRSEEEAWKKAFIKVVAETANIVSDAGFSLYAERLINLASREGGKMVAQLASSNAVSDLLCVAANVQDGERVLDGAIGYGYSAAKCIKGRKDVELYGVDINNDSIQVATLYLILCGANFETTPEDFTSMPPVYEVDKVVMDIPFGMKTMSELSNNQLMRVQKWMDTDSCREMECLFMASALDAMKDTGRFVVIVPQGILFRQSKALSTFRRNLIKEGLLKAVVSLPPVYNSTTINTAMLVLERNNKDVLFVDASNLVQRERRNDAYITEDNKKLLQEILEEKKEIDKISFKVSNAQVFETGDWSISRYIDAEVEVESRSLSEINGDLIQYYKKLEELNERSNSLKLFI